MSAKTFADLLAGSPKPKEDTTSSGALPVDGGRQTVPEGVSTIGRLLLEFSTVDPDFNIQLLKALEQLSIFNAEISYAVDNIVQLGNTEGSFPSNIKFDDGVPDTQIKEMLQLLKRKSKKWYKGGLNSLSNDLLAQACINGALSAEIVPDNSLSGVYQVVTVAPKTIKFKFDADYQDYKPYQYMSGTNAIHGIPLNETTYKYYALRKVTEKPYGIPPFISALENIQISRDMSENLKAVVKKLGMLGFLEVLVNGPSAKAGETDAEYYKRTEDYLKKVVPQIDKGLAKGYVVGFKDQHEFKLQPTAGNVAGAKDLLEINDTKLFAGLKQDPLLFGRHFSTTESLARVILAKMTTQVGNYQRLLATFLEELFLLELQLSGYKIENIEISFTPPMIGDGQRKETTRTAKIANLSSEYNMGIISLEVMAQELGREKPDQEEPRVPVNPVVPEAEDGTEKEDVTKSKDDKKTEDKKKANKKLQAWQINLISNPECSIVDVTLIGGEVIEHVLVLDSTFIHNFSALDVESIAPYNDAQDGALDTAVRSLSTSLGGTIEEYEYTTADCNCGDCGDSGDSDDISFISTGNSDLDNFIRSYFNSTKAKYDRATKKSISSITDSLEKLGNSASIDRIKDVILYTIFKDWNTNFSRPQQSVVNQFVKSVYTFFRKDSGIFGSASDIPKGVFSTTDIRALDYYKKSDNLYLGKFITDKDLNKKITKYLKDEYLEGDLPLGNNVEALNKFKEEFAGVLQGQDWKIARIINTTVNKMRNTASLSYMSQADVEHFEIVGVNDRLQCPYCKNLQGKKFSVSKAITQFDNLVQSDPEYVKLDTPFVTSVFKSAEEMEGLSSDELQAKGIALPPYHSNCRDQIVAIL